jgi:hypothetical protein
MLQLSLRLNDIMKYLIVFGACLISTKFHKTCIGLVRNDINHFLLPFMNSNLQDFENQSCPILTISCPIRVCCLILSLWMAISLMSGSRGSKRGFEMTTLLMCIYLYRFAIGHWPGNVMRLFCPVNSLVVARNLWLIWLSKIW